MIQAVQDAAWKSGCIVEMINTGGNAELEAEAKGALLARQVDGALYATMHHRVVDVPVALRECPAVLTTIALPHYAMGHRSARLLIDRIEREATVGPRSSCGPLRPTTRTN